MGQILSFIKQVLELMENCISYYLSNENAILLRINACIFLIALLMGFALLIWLITLRILIPVITILKETVTGLLKKVSKNCFVISTGKKIRNILNSFNNRDKGVRNHNTDPEEMQRAYERFFPGQFIDYLDRTDIFDLQRMDYKSYEMGVLMTDICSFYSFSKDMSDEERFDFLDKYINKVGPPIYKDGGFISKLTGNGVMALFPKKEKADKLLETGLSIRKSIREYNVERAEAGEQTFSIGMGLHVSKSVLLGIVGFESRTDGINRLEAAVLDEEVVLTETVQNAARDLGASIIASEAVIGNLEYPSKYRYRYLGLALFENIQQKVNIYDVYQEDEEELRDAKESTKKQFEEGVLLYQKREFKEAKNIFIDIIGINDRDLAAKRYYFLCDEYSNMDKLPQNWDKQISL